MGARRRSRTLRRGAALDWPPMETITIEGLLPALVMLTVSLALLWLLFWLATRALRRWFAAGLEDNAQAGAVEDWAKRLTLFLRRVTAGASLLIAVLIMIYGLGVRGLPQVSWEQVVGWLRGSGLSLLFIAGSAWVLIRAASMLTRALPDALVAERLPYAERMDRRKRVATRGRLARWLFTAVVLGIAGVMILRLIGIDVTPLLAGGAIVSVALGFGAQNLVRDVIAGVFMIVENQLRVGDIASINGKSGVVESIRLRTTTLRSLDGNVHVFQNGLVSDLSNMTMNYSYAVIELGVAYKENVDVVMELLHVIGAELQADSNVGGNLLAPLEVLGVEDFAASAVIIKMRVRTVPGEQWTVARELRRRIKNRFDADGIELPIPHLSVYARAAGKPFEVNVGADEADGAPRQAR